MVEHHDLYPIEQAGKKCVWNFFPLEFTKIPGSTRVVVRVVVVRVVRVRVRVVVKPVLNWANVSSRT